MAKMQNSTSGLREIPLSQIVDNGNVRVEYREIEELAESIKNNGQLEPVLVKPLEKDADGIERYELIAGHRRRRAVQYLCDRGESFTSVKALIVTGDKLTLQLVENIQRSDLTAVERESGIYAMCKNGLSQKEVAARLAKPETFISRNVSAFKVREAARAAGVDTSGLATGTLNEIQAAEAADYAELVKEILRGGGTSEVARSIMEKYRVAHGRPANPQKAREQGAAQAEPETESMGSLRDPLGITPLEGGSFGDGLKDEPGETPPPEKFAQKAGPQKSPTPPERRVEEFNPPHKQVDFNTMCVAIMKYADRKFKECPTDANFNSRECGCEEFCEAYYKQEAAKDIIALLHTEL
ncbi:MAG: ParB/RepB/Spo0J family partition protein [Spirochaetaceae bacterium]|jgi:ParB/RepB/Spo0J family partition protein|nr:ParB/RepB/Spo0J family partition protein [Spirochaetaceae bacterium]